MALSGNGMGPNSEDTTEDVEEDFYGSNPFLPGNANGDHTVPGAEYEQVRFVNASM